MEDNSQLIKSLLSEINPVEQSKVDARMEIAARIASAMETKGWGNEDLENAFGINSFLARKWLSGTHNFSMDTLVEIEHTLNLRLLIKKE